MSGESEKNPPEPVHQPGAPKGEEIVEDEGKEPGRQDTGTTGAGRPAGTSTSRDATGVDPEGAKPVDPNSPTLPPA